VGQTRALDWTLTGRVFAAHEARDAGLFTTLVARRADVLPRALAYADMIASQCAPQMTVLARALMWHGLHADVSGTHLLESKCVQHAWNNVRACMTGGCVCALTLPRTETRSKISSKA
jgi:enoyl-CoA hydratase/carnithine racemase